ncbi:hypothetical protein ECZU47_50600 [Escherichia coli]|uniref:glycosyltransferase n=1 Tax=Escherichia coli TaxID=562 RepID=UPI0019159A08|nr:glycosyltransferase [Escherichia coli]GHM41638.1 hypothetical protein ECZU47_50600 [Escherichia coli]
MKILVYGINYSPELTGIGKYTGEMVEWLAAQGHEVRVITAPPYPQWQVGENYSARRYKRKRGRHGVALPAVRAKTAEHPETPVASRQFAVSSFPLMAQRRWKPDRIIGVVPTLFCTPGMRLLAKLSGARTVLHIQDYEVNAMLGLGLAGKGKGGKVAQLATAFERGLHNVDNVSTISRSMMNKAIEKAWRRKTSSSSPTGRKLPVFSMLQMPMLTPFVTSLTCRITKNHSLLRQYW